MFVNLDTFICQIVPDLWPYKHWAMMMSGDDVLVSFFSGASEETVLFSAAFWAQMYLSISGQAFCVVSWTQTGA